MNQEIKSAARDMARKGLHGNLGEPLPNLMSTEAVNWINSNLKVFQHMVSIERIIWRCVQQGKVVEG